MPTTDKFDLLDDQTLQEIRSYVEQKAKQYAPSHIAPGIKSSLVPYKGGYSIKWEVDIKMFKDARAQEYGSGTRSTRNFQSKHQQSPKGTIRIEGSPYLAFPWEINKSTGEAINVKALYAGKKKGKAKFVGQGKANEKLIFKYVDHPGIRPANNGRGYLRVALKDSQEKVKEMVGNDLAKGLLLKSRQIFVKVSK